MKFIIKAYDGKDEDALTRRMRVRPEHLENLKKVKETGSVICAGGIINDSDQPIGSFLVMDFESREQLDVYIESEPYVKYNVWQEIQIETCKVAIMNDELVD